MFNVVADISLIFLSLYFKYWFSARLCTSGRWRDPETRHNLPRTHSCVKTTHSSLIAHEVAPFFGILCAFLWRTDKNSHSNFPSRLLLFLGPGRPLQTSILAREPRYVLDELHTHTHTHCPARFTDTVLLLRAVFQNNQKGFYVDVHVLLSWCLLWEICTLAS